MLTPLKVIVAATVGAVLWSGCMTPKQLALELSRDNATVSVKVSTIYGTMQVFRSNPTENKVSVNSDGTFTITPMCVVTNQ